MFLILRLWKFDIAVAHMAYFHADVVALAGRILGRPVWVKVAASGRHGEIQRMKAAFNRTPLLGLRWATRVQAISDDIQREVLAAGVSRDHIVRIPNGVDTSTFTPATANERWILRNRLSLPPNKSIVIFVGRFARHKGVEELVTAWQALKREDAILILLGSALTMDSVGQITEQETILVPGWTHAVADYLRAADIFVLPSYVEGMSNAMLEAMACGMPVIVSRVGAAAAIVRHGQNGLLVSPGNVAELQSRLRQLLEDRGLRLELGAMAVDTIRKNYSKEGVIDAIEKAQCALSVAK